METWDWFQATFVLAATFYFRRVRGRARIHDLEVARWTTMCRQGGPSGACRQRSGTHPIAQMAEVMPKEFGRVMAALTAEGCSRRGGRWPSTRLDRGDGGRGDRVHHPRRLLPTDLKKGSVKASRVPGGKVAFTVHVGPYEQIAAAYAAIQAYARANRLKLGDTMWERYLHRPAVDPTHQARY